MQHFLIIDIILTIDVTTCCQPPNDYEKRNPTMAGSFFKLYNDHRTFDNAKSKCAADGAALATLQHPTDLDEIKHGTVSSKAD